MVAATAAQIRARHTAKDSRQRSSPTHAYDGNTRPQLSQRRFRHTGNSGTPASNQLRTANRFPRRDLSDGFASASRTPVAASLVRIHREFRIVAHLDIRCSIEYRTSGGHVLRADQNLDTTDRV